jgi:glycosyltransferase involved in cell wall biosynthesis
MKLLLVTFYFPPAGGGGVQRPLKFAEHLAAAGVEVHVLAPDDPQWIYRDEGLVVPKSISVCRARYVGPAGRRPAEELFGRHGIDRLSRKVALTPRRLLVPDENVTWVAWAIPAAVQLIRRERIDVVLTTSPPTSVHLIGAAARRLTGVRWVADLRDSIVAKSDRRYESAAVRLKEQAGRQVARMVARRADAVVAVTPTIADEERRLGGQGPIFTIPNGCDFDDFEGVAYHRSDRFRITHTGSFFGRRTAQPFLEALTRADPVVVARFVGDFRGAELEWAEQLLLENRIELHGFLPRQRVLELQRNSEALLLLLPELGRRGKDVPSGKVYEYLAAERPILAVVPPDGAAADLIRDTRSGIVVAPDDPEALRAALDQMVDEWRRGSLAAPQLTPEMKLRLSRKTLAGELLRALEQVNPVSRAT